MWDIRGSWISGLSRPLLLTPSSTTAYIQHAVGRATSDQGRHWSGEANAPPRQDSSYTVRPPEPFVPQFPSIALPVRDDPAFQDPGEPGHEAWLRMLPAGNGLVQVRHPSQYGLPRSEKQTDGYGREVADVEVYEVAVVRELECLLVVRELLGRYEELGKGYHGQGGGKQGEVVQDWERVDALRCLDHCKSFLILASGVGRLGC